VINPFAGDGVGFSVKSVTVNGDPITDDVVNSAFEIDLSKLNFYLGDSVNIKIYHDSGSLPRIINEYSVYSVSLAKFTDLRLNSSGLLSWCVTGDSLRKTSHIEQYKWNKWIDVGEIERGPSDSISCYEYQTSMTSGMNKFRIVEYDLSNYANKSPAVSNISRLQNVEMLQTEGSDIYLSDKTHYELFNSKGQLIMRGYDKYLSLDSFDPGIYYLCYDRIYAEVFRKY